MQSSFLRSLFFIFVCSVNMHILESIPEYHKKGQQLLVRSKFSQNSDGIIRVQDEPKELAKLADTVRRNEPELALWLAQRSLEYADEPATWKVWSRCIRGVPSKEIQEWVISKDSLNGYRTIQWFFCGEDGLFWFTYAKDKYKALDTRASNAEKRGEYEKALSFYTKATEHGTAEQQLKAHMHIVRLSLRNLIPPSDTWANWDNNAVDTVIQSDSCYQEIEKLLDRSHSEIKKFLSKKNS
ncbi:hypothetical protein A3F06_00630 [candidate division TM6 bacterium RIFCSPHIGHO2_12_FULL_36_22]|nr:MAG: hypothetical protein A3F06_00630 [candidate division TM6 bacterium RIFCSPHIGHO2_12_FULL_36_22]